MNFETIRDAIITTLGNDAAGRFTAIGFKRQGKSADEVKTDASRLVQVSFTKGRFPKERGAWVGSCTHEVELSIGLTVSSKAKVDLSVLNNAAATVGQLTTALLNLEEASYLVDVSFDNLAATVYEILKDGNNVDFGLAAGVIRSPWLGEIKKDNPQPKGGLVVITGEILFSFTTTEDTLTATGTTPDSVDVVLDIDGDDVEQTGVEIAL